MTKVEEYIEKNKRDTDCELTDDGSFVGIETLKIDHAKTACKIAVLEHQIQDVTERIEDCKGNNSPYHLNKMENLGMHLNYLQQKLNQLTK